MLTNIDKRETAARLRSRIIELMNEAGETQSGLARALGVDRSTVSQLLGDRGARMPGAHLVAQAARHFEVSTDWLLGLSDHREMASDLVESSLSITAATRALIDDQLLDWHREAAGYKIRHVPTGLPDMLKTAEFLRWEVGPQQSRDTDHAIETSTRRLALLRETAADLEIALPVQELEALSRAEGNYRDLPETLRRAQLAHMATLSSQLYPAMRVYLYDARQVFSVPLTVFGPRLAALYLGQNYLVFRDAARVARFAAHIDSLIRTAQIPARDTPTRIAGLIER